MSKIKNVVTLRELIPIAIQKLDRENVQTLNARDLWEFLGVETPFNKWIQRNIKRYDFIDGQDYVCWTNLSNKQGKGGQVRYSDLSSEGGQVRLPNLASETGSVCSRNIGSKSGSGGHNISVRLRSISV